VDPSRFVKVGDLARDTNGEIAYVESADPADSALSGKNRAAERLFADPVWAHYPNPSHHRALWHSWSNSCGSWSFKELNSLGASRLVSIIKPELRVVDSRNVSWTLFIGPVLPLQMQLLQLRLRGIFPTEDGQLHSPLVQRNQQGRNAG